MQAKGTDSARASSVYADRTPNSAEHRNVASINSRTNTGSRPTSYTPSYMSNIARKPAPTERSTPIDVPRTPTRPPAETVEMPANEPPSSSPAGTLLVIAHTSLHPSTLSYVQLLLKKQNFATIVIAASAKQEAALKQLKMDVYGLIGQLRREIGVHTITKDKWNLVEIEALVQEAMRTGSSIHGVLCCPSFAEANNDTEIFSLEDEDVQHSWASSVGFLHTTAKASKDHLLSRCKLADHTSNGISKIPQGPFFLVAGSASYNPLSQIAKAACDTLLLQLARLTQTQRLVVGYAENILIPEPEPEIVPEPEVTDVPNLRPVTYTRTPEDAAFAPESPTKLWNMWALQEEIGVGSQ